MFYSRAGQQTFIPDFTAFPSYLIRERRSCYDDTSHNEMPQKERHILLFPIIGVGMGSPSPLHELLQGPNFPPSGASALARRIIVSENQRECGRAHAQHPEEQTWVLYTFLLLICPGYKAPRATVSLGMWHLYDLMVSYCSASMAGGRKNFGEHLCVLSLCKETVSMAPINIITNILTTGLWSKSTLSLSPLKVVQGW